jgi:hypothetical protein
MPLPQQNVAQGINGQLEWYDDLKNPCSLDDVGKYKCIEDTADNIDYLGVCAVDPDHPKYYTDGTLQPWWYSVICKYGCIVQNEQAQCAGDQPIIQTETYSCDMTTEEAKTWFNTVTAGFYSDELQNTDSLGNLGAEYDELSYSSTMPIGQSMCLDPNHPDSGIKIVICRRHTVGESDYVPSRDYDEKDIYLVECYCMTEEKGSEGIYHDRCIRHG